MYLPVPVETTSLRGLALEVLFWPRNGVGLRTVPELSMEAIVSWSQEGQFNQFKSAGKCMYGKGSESYICGEEKKEKWKNQKMGG